MLPEILVLYFFTCISHAFFLTIFVFHVTEDVFIIFKQNIAKWGTRKKCSHVLKKKLRKVLPLGFFAFSEFLMLTQWKKSFSWEQFLNWPVN